MNLSILRKSNPKAKNVFNFFAPYYYLNKQNIGQPLKGKAVFWGTCFKLLSGDLNIDEYVKKTNECLDYVRRECSDCELYYKPHPSEKEELKLLDLRSFNIVSDSATAEIYLWKNLGQVVYSFSILSNAAISAYDFGINSYVFYRLLRPAFGQATFEALEDYFQAMPSSFFINNLAESLRENRVELVKDNVEEAGLKQLLEENNGKIWFNIVEPALAMVAVSLVKQIKEILPDRKICLLISKQRRWSAINIDDIGIFFDEIKFLPRVSFSLKPGKILEIIGQALKVKNLAILKNDVIISFLNFPNFSFVENCLISYFKKNKRVAICSRINFDTMYALKYSQFFAVGDFKTKPASQFFGKILEPILGLNKTIYLQYGDGKVFNVTRYEKPLEEIFDRVYILNRQN